MFPITLLICIGAYIARTQIFDLILIISNNFRETGRQKIARFDKNITKRGFVPETTTKKGKDYPIGPILLSFFVFIVIGSSLFQIIRTATSGGMAYTNHHSS
ncbi:hypothetical protein HID58_025666 [Brassica napus]|uniref:BnaA07g08870D protein n=3 Tax=Brassica TaxID=3705 RepID=A0A078FRE5_BRANA|nr:hypothetical protein HID58_025666 [Brassica napus]CAF2160608.1 unnamed protein product [Brassica napus]CAG7901738.1 unnamed protein product [Brassica rapa]CDY15716.1 BnaA07g08870D [Brassica napus]VDC97348.1 unnamed protein product [Brassica rapa]